MLKVMLAEEEAIRALGWCTQVSRQICQRFHGAPWCSVSYPHLGFQRPRSRSSRCRPGLSRPPGLAPILVASHSWPFPSRDAVRHYGAAVDLLSGAPGAAVDLLSGAPGAADVTKPPLPLSASRGSSSTTTICARRTSSS